MKAASNFRFAAPVAIFVILLGFLGYRLFFFVLPLVIAAILLAVDTVRQRVKAVQAKVPS